MATLAMLLISCLTIIAITSVIKSTRTQDATEQEQYLFELQNEIDMAQQHLNALNDQIARQQTQVFDTHVDFTPTQLKVLDKYETLGIRLPVDILEDLSRFTFYTEQEVEAFIEHQRGLWKLENTKKLPKGGFRNELHHIYTGA